MCYSQSHVVFRQCSSGIIWVWFELTLLLTSSISLSACRKSLIFFFSHFSISVLTVYFQYGISIFTVHFAYGWLAVVWQCVHASLCIYCGFLCKFELFWIRIWNDHRTCIPVHQFSHVMWVLLRLAPIMLPKMLSIPSEMWIKCYSPVFLLLPHDPGSTVGPSELLWHILHC